jgi:hypothetical protein
VRSVHKNTACPGRWRLSWSDLKPKAVHRLPQSSPQHSVRQRPGHRFRDRSRRFRNHPTNPNVWLHRSCSCSLLLRRTIHVLSGPHLHGSCRCDLRSGDRIGLIRITRIHLHTVVLRNTVRLLIVIPYVSRLSRRTGNHASRILTVASCPEGEVTSGCLRINRYREAKQRHNKRSREGPKNKHIPLAKSMLATRF